MPVRRATRAAAVALLLLSSIAVVSTAPAGAQADEPTVTVTPAVDLVDRQIVQLSGTGFPVDTGLSTGQCPPGVGGNTTQCDLSTVERITTDADGSFTIEVTVNRFLMNGAVDCADGGCTIGATDLADADAATPTDFLDLAIDEQFTATPIDDLLPGQSVTVSGTDYPADSPVSVRLCGPGATLVHECTNTFAASATTDAAGTFTTDIDVARFINGPDGTRVDCATVACSIGVRARSSSQFVPMSFRDVAIVEQSTVSPREELLEGQPVTVSGTGYTPDGRFGVGLCGPGATEIFDCSNLRIGTADAAGRFTVEVGVTQFIPDADARTVDCAAVACSIGVLSTITQFVPISFADDPLPTGTVAANPSTDLLHDQLVELDGTGFVPGIDLVFAVCRSGATDLSSPDCWNPSIVRSEAGPSGSFTVDVQVERYLDGDDCAEVSCAIVGFTSSRRPLGIEAPISFADVPPPARTVEVLTTDLVDGARAMVAGSGSRPDAQLQLSQCPAAPTTPEDCNRADGFAIADSEGVWEAGLRISRVLRPEGGGPVVDCAVETCKIAVTSESRLPVSGPLDIVDPGIEIDLHPDATLLAGTDEVVAQLTVSCDTATPVSVQAAVSQQPGIASHWHHEGMRCTPDDPLLIFVPNYSRDTPDDAFTLGEAELTASVSASRWHRDDDPASVFTEASGTIELHDHAMVVAAVQAAIADPANAEFRDEVLKAILVRLNQDSRFRTEWEAGSTPG